MVVGLSLTSHALIARSPRASRAALSENCYVTIDHRDWRNWDPQTLNERPLINSLPPKVSQSFQILEGPGESTGAHIRFGAQSERVFNACEDKTVMYSVRNL